MNKEAEARKQKIEERKKFLKLVMVFVGSFVLEKGKVTDKGTGGYGCSTVKRRLSNFGGFSFIWESNLGDYIEILDKKGKQLLSFRNNSEGFEVTFFNCDYIWQPSLIKVMKHKDEIFAEINAAKEREQQALRDKTAEEKILADLDEEAKRLKI
ncbi:hypothetical protein M0Q50_00310 [bacterium]|jgi:hypothetical protein|nr:hypothetical protein [bacterium]